MTDLSVNYLGLKLKSPLVVGSSNLSMTLSNLKKIEDAGAGAVVLKSIFEEEIYHEYADVLKKEDDKFHSVNDNLDYFDFKIKEENIKKYIEFLKEAKAAASIPVIGSINCVSNHEWMFFAKKIQEAGADALELNLFIMPSDMTKTAQEIESIYLDIAKKIKSEITIPVALKISYYFSNLAGMVKKLSETDINGLVLFNRFFAPDFDIDKFEVIPTNILSSASDLHLSLRWVSLLSGRINKDIIASTGVHDGKAFIKLLLAGATAVQAVSVFYEKGFGEIKNMLNELNTWMEKHNFSSIDDFRGKMSQATADDPAVFERVQFMKYFGEKTYDID